EAVDDVDGDLTESVEITEDLDMNVPGEYTVNYEVADNSGNITTETRKVVVLEDNEAPVIRLDDDTPIELEGGETYEEPETTDNKVPEDYTVNYEVADNYGNITTETRKVVVLEDNEAPVITLNDDTPIELEVGETYEEPGATAEDNVDGDITDDIEITGEVNT